MSELKYEMDINFRTNDFDSNDYITPTAILSLFQDIAGLHAEELGIGYEGSLKMGYYWVLVRNRFEIFKNPKPLTRGHLVTWPHEKGRVDCNREYVLYDSYGDVVARGLSKWVIIDVVNRRIARTDKIDYGKGSYPSDNYYDDVPKIKAPDFSLFKKVASHKVLKRDLDHNKHMNNSKYTDIIFDIIPEGFKINKLNIEYIKETTLNDLIDIYEYEDELYIYHIGICGENKIFISQIVKD